MGLLAPAILRACPWLMAPGPLFVVRLLARSPCRGREKGRLRPARRRHKRVAHWKPFIARPGHRIEGGDFELQATAPPGCSRTPGASHAPQTRACSCVAGLAATVYSLFNGRAGEAPRGIASRAYL